MMKSVKAKVLVVCCSMSILAAPAQGRGIPVIDIPAIGQLLTQVGVQGQQLMEFRNMVSSGLAIKNAIGGVGKGNFLGALNSIGMNFPEARGLINNADDLLRAYSEGKYVLDGIQNKDFNRLIRYASHRWAQAQQQSRPSGTPTGGGLPSNHITETDLENASRSTLHGSRFAQKAFYIDENQTTTIAATTAIRAFRNDVARDTYINGWGLAIHLGDEAAGVQDRLKALKDEIDASQDLRGDVQAQTTVLFSAIEPLTQLVAIQSKLLEVETMKEIVKDPELTRKVFESSN